MKITYITGDNSDEEDGTNVRVGVSFGKDVAVAEAVASVLALFAGQAKTGGERIIASAKGASAAIQAAITDAHSKALDGKVPELGMGYASQAEEPKEEPKVTRPRRPRTNPDAPAADAPADASAPAGRRRRGTDAAAAEPEVKVITDADLAKAASNAAAIIGHEVVTAVLDEVFQVKMVSDIPADQREKFLKELDDEIELAKAELAGAGK
jgi:hypothetical protein